MTDMPPIHNEHLICLEHDASWKRIESMSKRWRKKRSLTWEYSVNRTWRSKEACSSAFCFSYFVLNTDSPGSKRLINKLGKRPFFAASTLVSSSSASASAASSSESDSFCAPQLERKHANLITVKWTRKNIKRSYNSLDGCYRCIRLETLAEADTPIWPSD